MKIAIFCHSLRSDWNHGNAHFLRGIISDLQQTHRAEVVVYEPEANWSYENLLQEPRAAEALAALEHVYPGLRASTYRPQELDLDEALAGADLVLVHEWNDHDLVARIGEHRKRSRRYRLLFHDTHHRSVTEPESMGRYDLAGYDGVLAFGNVIRQIYEQNGWTQQAWTWHEAADIRVFRPLQAEPAGDLVWIGNWGDEERTAELHEFLIEPVRKLGLTATVYGVRYPEDAKRALAEAGINYGGWLPNFMAPQVFAQHRVTVHVPRRPYVEALPGIPTIRPFEALACGIPLVSAPWDDAEALFEHGDFLWARDGYEMTHQLERILKDQDFARETAEQGLRTIRGRHTCSHRVQELLAVYNTVKEGEAVGSI